MIQTRVPGEERTSVEDLPRSDWPVGLSVEHCLLCWLRKEGPVFPIVSQWVVLSLWVWA